MENGSNQISSECNINDNIMDNTAINKCTTGSPTLYSDDQESSSSLQKHQYGNRNNNLRQEKERYALFITFATAILPETISKQDDDDNDENRVNLIIHNNMGKEKECNSSAPNTEATEAIDSSSDTSQSFSHSTSSLEQPDMNTVRSNIHVVDNVPTTASSHHPNHQQQHEGSIIPPNGNDHVKTQEQYNIIKALCCCFIPFCQDHSRRNHQT
jgi:hypothetical protein